MARQLPMLINGEFVASQTDQWIPVTNPATQEVLCEAPAATAGEMEQAIASAKAAFADWKEVPVSERARLMLRYQALLKEHQEEIAEILSQETGKTFEDAKGDVWRGIEVAEQAANIASLMMGEPWAMWRAASTATPGPSRWESVPVSPPLTSRP